jgi:beta-phosphoglucomutase-like phosphatase (HAD superfamily)
MVPHGKPFPDLFLLCAEKCGCEPESCIVVEDSLPGIAAAKAAKMPFLWFSGAIHSEKYANQIVHYAGVRSHPDAQALETSLRDYCFIER